MQYVQLGNLSVSRFILGGNPFSGFSHQSPAADLAMKRYYTTSRIKDTLRQAEALGVNTVLCRSDAHIMRLLFEYWDEGGCIQWFAQTAPELGSPEASIHRAADAGAKAVHIHGGVMDFLFAQNRLSEVPPLIDLIHSKGMLAGVAGHNPQVIAWAEEQRLPVDYYMCSYYNPTRRDERPEHVHGLTERFADEDRQAMTGLIPQLTKPVIHYKIMAAGRNNPAEAFAFAAGNMRNRDLVCVGIFDQAAPNMLRQDIDLLLSNLRDEKRMPSHAIER